ncbi:MAG: hypothetical protein U0271_21695 [Polyangiaceae bacterium]
MNTWLRKQLIEFKNLAINSWLVFDRRTLGFTRLLLGFYLIMDLFRRTADWEHMFADTGVLPTYVILKQPQANGFSFLHAFTSAPELWCLWAVILVVYVCLFVGYRTKLAQILSVFIVTSMNGRVLLIENGGYVVQSLVCLWCAFTPMGDRFSVDAMLASLKRKRERTAGELNDRSDLVDERALKPFISVVGIAVALQIAAVYYFNVVHKTGPAWKKDWTAVHYVMWVDRMVTPLIAHVRYYVPPQLYRVMTVTVIAAEATIPLCTLLPQLSVFGFDTKLWLKRIGFVLINFLHVGFGSSFVLGPFAWALCVFSNLLIGYQDWETSIRAMKRPHRKRTVVFDPSSGAALLFCRVVARMDRFGFITFVEAAESERKTGPAIQVSGAPSGVIKTGGLALADIIAALPVGPVFAWMFRFGPGLMLADALMRRGRISKTFGLTSALPAGSPASPVRGWFRSSGRAFSEVFCAVVLVAELNQAMVELWTSKGWWAKMVASVNEKHHWKLEQQPEPLRNIPHKMRFLQGWFMFSPNPVMDDGTIVVDAITVDGRHVDPFWGKPPNFDLQNAKSFGYNQIWSDYFNRIHLPGNRAYRDAAIDYMRRLPERTGNPNDKIVSGEVYWVRDMNPRFGKKQSWGGSKELLFTFGEEGGNREPPNKPRI